MRHLLIIILALTILSASPQYVFAQVDEPVFGIILKPKGKTRTPGRRYKYRRNFRVMWDALNPNGTNRPGLLLKAKPKKNTAGGVGTVGNMNTMDASNNDDWPDTKPPAVAIPAPKTMDNDEPKNYGGIGQIGNASNSEIEDETSDYSIPVMNNATVESNDDEVSESDKEPVSTGGGIGKVGGIGSVGPSSQ